MASLQNIAPGEKSIQRIVNTLRQAVAFLSEVIPVANGGTGYAGGAWTPYTAVLTPTTGTITTQASNSAFIKIGKLVFCRIDVTVTVVGTAVVPLTVNLPAAAVGSTAPFQSAIGRESAVTGKSIAFRIKPGSAASAGLVNYDGTDAALALNSRYEFNFIYEAA